MTYANIMASLPRLLVTRDAEDYVANPAILARLRNEFGLRPVRSLKGGQTIYDRLQLDRPSRR